MARLAVPRRQRIITPNLVRAGRIPDPRVLPGCELWLCAADTPPQAAGSNVTSLRDMSGHGRDAAATNPANHWAYYWQYGQDGNGEGPAYEMSGNSGFRIASDLTTPSDWTLILVGAGRQSAAGGRGNAVNAGGYFLDSQNGRLVFALSGGSGGLAYYDGAWQATGFYLNGLGLVSWVLSAADGGEIYRNGGGIFGAGRSYTQKALGNVLEMFQDYDDANTSIATNFEFLWCALWSRALSRAERVALEYRLADCYGIPNYAGIGA